MRNRATQIVRFAGVRFALLAWAVVLVGAGVSCSDADERSPADSGGDVLAAGEEGARCYPNGTCNGDLVCASNLCVRFPDSGPAADAPAPGADVGPPAPQDAGAPDLRGDAAPAVDAAPTVPGLGDTCGGSAPAGTCTSGMYCVVGGVWDRGYCTVTCTNQGQACEEVLPGTASFCSGMDVVTGKLLCVFACDDPKLGNPTCPGPLVCPAVSPPGGGTKLCEPAK